MLFIGQKSGVPQPVLRCSVCDKTIASINRAAVIYPRSVSPGETMRVRVAHKGPCLDSAELAMENDGIPFQWMELTVYLWRLTESSRLTET